MAFPVVEEVLQQTFTTDTDNPLPVSMPATVNSGELLMIFVALNEQRNHVVPSGWTRIINHSAASPFMLFHRTADGSEGGTTVNVDLTSPSRASVQVWRISGWQAIEAASSALTISTTPDPPLLTPSFGAADTLWIALYNYDNEFGDFVSAPTNYINAIETSTSGSGSNGAELATARRENNTDTENPGTFSISDNAEWIAHTIGIQGTATSDTTALSGTVTSSGSQIQNAKVAIFTADDPVLTTLDLVEVASTDVNGDYTMSTTYSGGLHYVATSVYFDEAYNGIATSGNTNLLADSSQSFTASEFNDLQSIITISGGTGAGQTRIIQDNTTTEVTVSSDWVTPPDNTSVYGIGQLYSAPANFHPTTE